MTDEKYDPITGERLSDSEMDDSADVCEDENIDPVTGAAIAVRDEPGKPSVKEEPGKPAVKEEPGKPSVKEEPGELKVEEEAGQPAVKEAAAPPAEIDPVTGDVVGQEKPEKKGGILAALKGMISFFTIFRLNIGMREMDAMERHFWVVPIVGFIIGLMAFLVTFFMAAAFDSSYITQAVVALAVAYFFSKFIHVDGLVDFGDGMVCSSGKQEDHVRALKDTLVGAGGVGVAVITILLAVVLCADVSQITGFRPTIEFIVSVSFVAFGLEILVKNAQVAAAAFGKPGNGMAARQVGCTTKTSLVLSTILSVVLLAVVFLMYMQLWNMSECVGTFPMRRLLSGFVAAVVGSVVAGILMARTANSTFGFVNGDILGATNEISRVVILLFAYIVLAI